MKRDEDNGDGNDEDSGDENLGIGKGPRVRFQRI